MVGDRYQAKVISGQAVGAVYPIEKPEVVIGRNPVADIPVHEGDVSRRHAVIFMVNDEVHVRDEGSTNGTYHNGQRILAPVRLNVGDTIRLGSRETLVLELQPFSRLKEEKASQMPSHSQLAAIEAARQEGVDHLYRSKSPARRNRVNTDKRNNIWWILLLLAVGVLMLLGILFFWYIDTNFLWCWLVPVLPACP